MQQVIWADLDDTTRARVLARPAHRVSAEVRATVRRIFEDVQADGEAALARWSLALDGAAPTVLELDELVVRAARGALERDDLAAIEFAIEQVRFFHEATKPAALSVETQPGVRARRVWKPIDVCGLYVPAGAAPLVSTLIMLAEPAGVAGVPTRVVATPPGKNGAPHPALVAAAAACGLERLWLLGGVQAIAALALGVFTPKAAKVFGPGNAYVAEAKRYAASLPNGPAIDLPAGPSELLVIADRAADPVLVAADLLSQAEHDADAQVLLVSPSAELIDEVARALERQAALLPRREVVRAALKHARAIRVRSLSEAVDVANVYAPEHLALNVQRPDALLPAIVNAGAVFAGPLAAETFGDYVAGPSHVLPTDAAAKAYSGVSVESFMKSFVVQTIEPAGVRALAPGASRLARLEGLEAHARAADLRLEAVSALCGGSAEDSLVRRRSAAVVRRTRETNVAVSVDLERAAPVSIASGVGFFDHMLEQVAQHGGFALDLNCVGDLHIDPHHTIEDSALALGQALRQALGDRRGIARYGFVLPMDEAQASVALDLGGRPYLVFEGAFASQSIGAYPTQMTEHVFRSLSQALGATIHIKVTGENDHHMTEAIYKAVGRCLRQAIAVEGDLTPSTKGVL
ncbi:MAG TPA: histidinol dehydrogenase [Vitreimonas sp.]|uniref:histidinol dehydrogenase n=1 Tax=Vitreimonas sp. TaxID=3069702 RepID=UPI002D570464|nr:histidinol dehydrogenase [Vitreimonas sp.]HYD88090.1 histidinol dehydrogenase [Vitreimonas sp.]